jgi:2-aminoethylphosphonate-pyruvate transaminase
MYKQLLFCPGPVNTASNVRDIIVQNEIGHREREFSDLMRELHKNILGVFEIHNTKKYFPVIVSGSGSAANEAVLSSVVGNKTILTISNGEFGDRINLISKLHNKKTKHIAFPWGQSYDLKRIESAIKKYKPSFVAMVHHETCTGKLNPVAAVGTISKKYNAQLILDTVSSAGAEKIDIEKWNVAFCMTSASKALGALAGVSIVIGKLSEFKKLKRLKPKTMYLNLYKFFHYAYKHQQTPNTPAVPLFFALNQALVNILSVGTVEFRNEIAQRAKQIRSEVKDLGLSLLIEEDQMSSVLTTVKLPRGLSFIQLCAELRHQNIIIYNGKGPFRNKVFQIGNIGELSQTDVDFFLFHLRRVILEFSNERRQKLKRLPAQTADLPFLQIPSLAVAKLPNLSRMKKA